MSSVLQLVDIRFPPIAALLIAEMFSVRVAYLVHLQRHEVSFSGLDGDHVEEIMTREHKDLMSNLIAIMQNSRAGHETVILAADIISADSRFNLWVANRKLNNTLGDEMLDLIDLAGDVLEQCLNAVAEFESGGSEKKLQESLSEILIKLRNAIR